jgi:hypothetical protein
VDIAGEDVVSSAPPQPEARTRMASHHNSR